MLMPDANFKLHVIAQIINCNADTVDAGTLAILAQIGDVIDFGHNPFHSECPCENCTFKPAQ
jgi:hypothetical protein